MIGACYRCTSTNRNTLFNCKSCLYKWKSYPIFPNVNRLWKKKQKQKEQAYDASTDCRLHEKQIHRKRYHKRLMRFWNMTAILHVHISLHRHWIWKIQQSTQTISHKKQRQQHNILTAPNNEIHLIMCYASFLGWFMNCSIFLCYGKSILIMVTYCGLLLLLMKKTIQNGINLCKISDTKEKVDHKNHPILARHIHKKVSSDHLL